MRTCGLARRELARLDGNSPTILAGLWNCWWQVGRWDQLETNQVLNVKATHCTGELKRGGRQLSPSPDWEPTQPCPGWRESGSGRFSSPWEEAQHQARGPLPCRNTHKPKHLHLSTQEDTQRTRTTNGSLTWRYLLVLWWFFFFIN